MASNANNSLNRSGSGMIDVNTTIRYLKGELSFEAYSALLEQIQEETPDPDFDVLNNLGASEEVDATLYSKEDISSDQDESIDENSSKSTSERPLKPGRPRQRLGCRMPKHLQGLMGEANLQFARGAYDEAIKMCMELIRQAPNVPEPFQTLSLIYDALHDRQKTFQYGLIAAHLLRYDADEWLKMAEMSLELGKPEDVLRCYNAAARSAPRRADVQLLRAEYLEKLGDVKKAMDGYELVLPALSSDDGEKYTNIARQLVQYHSVNNNVDKAIQIFEKAFELHLDFIWAEDVNLLLELYISQQVYTKPLQVLIQHCGVCLYYPDNSILTSQPGVVMATFPVDIPPPIRCTAPDEMPVDLRAKLSVCLIRLKYDLDIQEVLEPLLAHDPNVVGDLHLDVCEALMDTGRYSEAKPILYTLIHSAEYNKAAVWLRYAQCLVSNGDREGAVEAYRIVIKQAPGDVGARLTLSALLKQLGKKEEALQALHHDFTYGDDSTFEDLQLLLPMCGLLESENRLREMIECIKKTLFMFMTDDFMEHSLLVRGNVQARFKHFRDVKAAFPGLSSRFNAYKKSMQLSKVTVDNLWELFVKACNLLADWGDYEELNKFCWLMKGHPLVGEDQSKADDLNFICMSACMLSNDKRHAYKFIRTICLKNIDNNRAWNLLGQVSTCAYDQRMHKFIVRLLNKNPEHTALSMCHGHNSLISGSYKQALGEYVSLFRQDPNNPLLCLLVGLIYIHVACQRFSARRHLLVAQGCSFLNQYQQLRGETQETYYNLGRAMHQLGLLFIAVHYYEKALTFEPMITGPEQQTFDLRREIAFNLSTLYRRSGSSELAALLAQKYLVI